MSSSKIAKNQKSESSLLHLQIHSLHIHRPSQALTDAMVYQQISNDRKEQALYLLLEEGWEIERVAHALGVSMQSVERWEENYAIHGCVKLFKPTRGCPRLLTGDMIDDIQRYFAKTPVFFLMRLRNGSLSTTTSPSPLQLCT